MSQIPQATPGDELRTLQHTLTTAANSPLLPRPVRAVLPQLAAVLAMQADTIEHLAERLRRVEADTAHLTELAGLHAQNIDGRA